MLRLAVLVVAIICSVQANASLVRVDYSLDLNNGVIYDCVDGTNTSSGNASSCWRYDTSIPSVAIEDLDTVLIDISFLPGQKLRWSDDGNTFFGTSSELLNVGLESSTQGFETSGTDYFFEFKDVTGNPFYSDVAWSMDPSTHNGGWAFLHSFNANIEDLTDSYFEFSGLTIKMDLFNLVTIPGQENKVSVDGLSMTLISGNFEILNTATSVPEPATYYLFTLTLLLFFFRKK